MPRNLAASFLQKTTIEPVVDEVALVIKGTSGQTFTLQQWQDSAGTVRASLNAGFEFSAMSYSGYGGISFFTAGQKFFQAGDGSRRILALNNFGDAATPHIIAAGVDPAAAVVAVKGAAAQTGDLQQWQNSAGTVLSKVGATGLGTFSGLFSVSDLSTRPAAEFQTLNNSSATTAALILRAPSSGAAGNMLECYQYNDALVASIGRRGAAYFDSLGIGAGGFSLAGNLSGPTLFNISATGGNAGGIGIGGAPGTPGTVMTVSPIQFNQLCLTIKGIASQTADLTQWQNSAGTVNSLVDANGGFYLHPVALTGSAQIMLALVGNPLGDFYGGSSGSSYATTGVVRIRTGVAANIGMTIVGAASQTANLQEWQDSAGLVRAKVLADGSFFIGAAAQSWSPSFTFQTRAGGWPVSFYNANGSAAFRTCGESGGVGAGTEIDGPASALLSLQINTKHVGSIGLVIKSIASQTADLTQWQNSAGTTISKVTAAGEPEVVTAGAGMIMASPNGTRYRVTVADDGALVTAAA